MHYSRFLSLAVILCTATLAAQADRHDRVQERMAETRARLDLTDEQIEKLKPILQTHFEEQRATLERYEVDLANRDRSRQLNPQTLRALRTELDEQSVVTEERLTDVVTAGQLAEFRKIREERAEARRERFRSAVIDAVGEALGLSAQQQETVAPILSDHFDAQLAILSEHGIGDSDRRLTLRGLRALRDDLDRSDAEILQRLQDSGAISARQLDAYEAMQAELKERRRALLRAGQ